MTKELFDILKAMTRLKANGDQPGLVIHEINYYNNSYWHHQPEINFDRCEGCEHIKMITRLHLGSDNKYYCSECLTKISD